MRSAWALTNYFCRIDTEAAIFPFVSESARRIYRNWVVACTIGELVGFGGLPVFGAAIALWLTSGLDDTVRSLVLYAVAIVGGLGEGAVLAWFQSRVLVVHIPGFNARRWMIATATAAAIAWACGMLAPTLDDVVGISLAVQISIWAVASPVMLVSIGFAQALVLRGAVENPSTWIVANAAGWLAGLPWTFVLPALLPESAPMAVWIATFVVAGVLMGVTVGLVTGIGLLRLRTRQAT